MSEAASAPTSTPTTDPFAPPGGEWHPVSPELVGIRRTTTLISALVVGAPSLGVAWWLGTRWDLWWLPVVIGLLVLPFFAWRWARAPRWVAAWGWCERDEDFCVRSGLWRRRLTIVPFGRLQVVKVAAGPLLRRKGLASVALVTATMETDADLPGLPADVAAGLRDRLIARSDAPGSGL